MSSFRFEHALGLSAAMLLASCSLGGIPRSDCDPEACQAAFGFGSVCGDDGYCRSVEPHARCERTFPPDLFTRPEQYGDTFVIGSLMDRSLATQRARENAAELAIRSANDEGGLEGRKFGIVFCDIQENSNVDGLSRQEAAVEMALYLARELRLPAIIGPSATEDVQEAFLALVETWETDTHRTLMMSPSATGAGLTSIDVTDPTDGSPGLLWRTAPPDTIQAEAIAQDMRSRSVGKVAVVHSTDAYGAGIADAFHAAFGDAILFPFTTNSKMVEQIINAGNTDADEVLFVSSQTDQAAGFINAIAGNPKYDDRGIFLTDSAANADFKENTSSASSRWPQIRGTRPSLPSGVVYDIFASRYRTEFTIDPAAYSFTAHAYDAAWLVLYGIVWAHFQEDAINGKTIARGLRRISSGPKQTIQPSTFPAIIAAFMNGESVDVEGASGELDYDPETEETTAPVEIWTMDDL